MIGEYPTRISCKHYFCNRSGRSCTAGYQKCSPKRCTSYESKEKFNPLIDALKEFGNALETDMDIRMKRDVELMQKMKADTELNTFKIDMIKQEKAEISANPNIRYSHLRAEKEKFKL